jgi:hypothetical protein
MSGMFPPWEPSPRQTFGCFPAVPPPPSIPGGALPSPGFSACRPTPPAINPHASCTSAASLAGVRSVGFFFARCRRNFDDDRPTDYTGALLPSSIDWSSLFYIWHFVSMPYVTDIPLLGRETATTERCRRATRTVGLVGAKTSMI